MKLAATRMLFSYWDGLRGERAAPERGEIEPGEIRHLLADTFILEMGDAGAEFRLAGTRLCALVGGELRGRRLSDLWGPAAREADRFVDIVSGETAGIVAGVQGVTAQEETVDLEMLLLPLRHRGKTHARLLGCLSTGALPLWLGLHPVTRLTTVSLRVIWPSGRAAAMPAARPGPDARRLFVVHRGGRT
jgi:hypothetical protein